MNEYAGFKVGDKVEITGHGPAIVGKITSFGDRKLGGCAEPDTLEVWINETTSFDLLYLMRRELIKKLHKYAVGDVVRRNGKIATIEEVSDTPPFFLARIYGEGSCWSLMSELETFDGFRVGDTVWTEKRGKGKICGSVKPFECASDTPFLVKFESYEKLKYPKLTNLFPTEQKMKEAINKRLFGFRIDTGFSLPFPGTMPNAVAEMLGYKWGDAPTPYNPFFGKIQIVGTATADHVRPKFKVGDDVLYNGEKWHIRKIEREEVRSSLCLGVIISRKYVLHRDDQYGSYVVVVSESDLRLWKETKFKGCVAGHEGKNPQYAITTDIPYLSNVKCIGKSAMDDDIFIADLNTGKQVILFGTKGDDNQ